MKRFDFFATAPKGIEPLLAEELQRLGLADVRPARGGVAFAGDLTAGYRACLWSRLANRVLLPLARFAAPDPDALYAGVASIDWSEHLSANGSLAVDATIQRSQIAHSHYAALKVKDAIVDQLREHHGERPSVTLQEPDLRMNLFLTRDEARLSIDLAGESLHRRGYRERGVAAPLKENLAAAILLRAGWPSIAAAGGACVDPMCGSGTLPIEAALIAADVAPGLQRTYFGFLRWRQHDEAAWKSLIDEAIERREQGLAQLPPIAGYDCDLQAVRAALGNVQRAGLGGCVHIERRALAEATALGPRPGLVVANPPYGERLGQGSQLVPLYQQLGEQLKQQFPGWRAAVLTANPELAHQLGLRAERSYTLFNGPLECKLGVYGIAAVRSDDPSGGAEMFANRLRKNLKRLGGWAARDGIDCYRLYDADLPEYALAVDLYRGSETWLHVQEYQAPKTVDPTRAGRRLREALRVLPEVLEIQPQNVYFKVRQRQKGTSQYERVGSGGRFHAVREGDVRLLVNFSDYLDTGLFLDHRSIRLRIARLAQGARFLNLFAYTGSASVHAAAGGARSTTTVDMSRTYLDWAARNLELNDCRGERHELIQADCLHWLQQAAVAVPRRRFDLIFLDPPTFSNSKRMSSSFDVQRDHVRLLELAMQLLAPQGLLLFSNNYRNFKLDNAALEGFLVEDISAQTIPADFARNPKIHHCFELRHRPR
jgi:23S rRNA (guanine2445-N2)-methyltransferase / 23S rRNA (guanine2069-N7)-methyltransferase